jgi:hypothetical protein
MTSLWDPANSTAIRQHKNTGFTQVWPPWWVTTYVLLVWLYWWGGYNGWLQRWRRLDLAKKWRALEVTSAQVDGGEKCLGPVLDLPPNLLYAKVGSRDCSPSQLQIESVWINPKQILIRLGLFLRALHCTSSLAPGPRRTINFMGLAIPSKYVPPGPKTR